MPRFKHLILDERISIEQMLKDSHSFKSIARELERDCTSISKEIKNHIIFKRTGSFGKAFNNCVHRFDCEHSYICDSPSCHNKYCRFCSLCSGHCSDYKEYSCQTLTKPPYVCNGCDSIRNCTLQKSTYSAAYAQKEYEHCLFEARSGITINEDELQRLDKIISPLIQRGQSIHNICFNNTDAIMHSEKSIYNYINYNLFSARNIDLPRKVRYRPRKKNNNNFKVDKSCRVGRTYQDFLTFMKDNPDTPVVEMDTVEGTKGGKSYSQFISLVHNL